MLMQNSIKLSAAVHQLSCTQAFSPYPAMVKNPKIQSCDLDFRHMTLKSLHFEREIHVPANFHQAECSGSWVIVVTENLYENNTVRRYRAPRADTNKLKQLQNKTADFVLLQDVRTPAIKQTSLRVCI